MKLQTLPDRIKLLLAALGIVLFTILFFRVLIFDPYAHLPGDSLFQDAGLRTYVVACFRAGHFPLWNPYLVGGYPTIGDPVGNPLYPFIALEALLPWGGNLKWFSIELTLHYMLATLFALLTCRCMGLAWFPSLIGATLVGFAGYLPFHGCQSMNVQSQTWCIALFWPIMGYWFTGKRWYLPLLSLFVALTWLGGHIQLAFYGFGFAMVLIALLWVLRLDGEARRPLLKKAGLMGAFLALGIGMAAVLLLPARDTVSRTQRSSFSAQDADIRMLPRYLPFVFLPNLSNPPGLDDNRREFLEIHIPDSQFYVGLLTLLCPLGLLSSQRRIRWLAATCLFLGFTAFLLCFGSQTILYTLFHQVVPFADRFRRPLAFMGAYSIFLPLAAALGVETVLAEAGRARVRWTSLGLGAAIAAVYLVLFFLDDSLVAFLRESTTRGMEVPVETIAENVRSILSVMLPLSLALLAGLILALPKRTAPVAGPLLLLVALADVSLNNTNKAYNTVRDANETFTAAEQLSTETLYRSTLPSPEYTHMPFSGAKARWRTIERVEGVWQNGKAALGLEGLTGYVNVTPERTIDYRLLITDLNSPLLKILNVRYFIEKPNRPPDTMDRHRGWKNWAELGIINSFFTNETLPSDYTLLPGAERWYFRAYGTDDTLPRFWITNDYTVIPDRKSRLEHLVDPSLNPNRVVLEQEPGIELTGQGQVQLLNYALAEINLRTYVKNGPALLFVADYWDPWWQATVDGKETPVYPAHHAFRALVVPEGTSDVVLRYVPRPFYTGLTVSGLSALIVLAFLGWTFWRDRRKHEGGVSPETEPAST